MTYTTHPPGGADYDWRGSRLSRGLRFCPRRALTLTGQAARLHSAFVQRTRLSVRGGNRDYHFFVSPEGGLHVPHLDIPQNGTHGGCLAPAIACLYMTSLAPALFLFPHSVFLFGMRQDHKEIFSFPGNTCIVRFSVPPSSCAVVSFAGASLAPSPNTIHTPSSTTTYTEFAAAL